MYRIAVVWLAVLLAAPLRAAPTELAAALAREDAAAIAAAVADGRAELGERAGEPETPDVFRPIPADAAPLSTDEASRAAAAYLRRLEAGGGWKIGRDPASLDFALRAPASVIGGAVAMLDAGLGATNRWRAVAGAAADFLCWAQDQAGTGGFPFPASAARPGDAAFDAARRLVERATRAGRRDEVVRGGWIVDDAGDGGLQFDNAECGVALFELHALTGDARHLAAARRAADWAARQRLVPNWNYNAFSVWLLAVAFQHTGERTYLEAARRKALLGVLPGQLSDGPRAGRWLDPHNARPAYHYILLRGLAALAAALPADDPDRPAVLHGLAAGLRARNSDFTARGAANIESALETLLTVASACDAEFRRDTRSDEALAALGRLVASELRAGRLPVGPRAAGRYLARAARPPLLTGGDISLLTRLEELGARYADERGVRDPLLILADRGCRLMRLRLWVKPSGERDQVCDLDYTLALARRIRQAGFQWMLDLHYSDTWADPGHQTPPAAWRDLDLDALVERVRAYSRDTVRACREAGVAPDYVQVGNEISNGLLWPAGRIGKDEESFRRLARLVRAGVEGVRAGAADRPVQVVVHSERGGQPERAAGFYASLQKEGVPFDAIGLSYYPYWHGPLERLRETMAVLAERIGKPILVVEAGYPWRGSNLDDGQRPMAYPATPEGQRRYLADLVAAVRAVPRGRGRGVLWWEPEWIPTKALGGGWSPRTLFDDEGRALPALEELRP